MMKIVESDPEDAGDTLRLCRLVSRQFERIVHVKRAFRVVRLGCYHKKTHHRQQCHDCFNPYKRFLRNDENTHIFTQVQELRFTSGCLNRGINEVKLHCEVLLNLLQPLSALKTLHLQDVILSLGTKQEWPWKPATASPWHRNLEQNIQQLIPKFSRFIILDSKLVLTVRRNLTLRVFHPTSQRAHPRYLPYTVRFSNAKASRSSSSGDALYILKSQTPWAAISPFLTSAWTK